jgi:hypothetical protein
VFTNVVRPKKVISPWLYDVGSDEIRRTSTRGATDHQAELDTLLDILLSANLDLEREHRQHGTVTC